jgi:hypothetical protein
VFTARYALSPYIKQIRFIFKGLIAKMQHASFQKGSQYNNVTTVKVTQRLTHSHKIAHSVPTPITHTYGTAAESDKQYLSDKITISNAGMSNEGSRRKLKIQLRVP